MRAQGGGMGSAPGNGGDAEGFFLEEGLDLRNCGSRTLLCAMLIDRQGECKRQNRICITRIRPRTRTNLPHKNVA